ncbi:MAG: hypothetical protein ABW168_29700 [Sedimenticola sp.]
MSVLHQNGFDVRRITNLQCKLEEEGWKLLIISRQATHIQCKPDGEKRVVVGGGAGR